MIIITHPLRMRKEIRKKKGWEGVEREMGGTGAESDTRKQKGRRQLALE